MTLWDTRSRAVETSEVGELCDLLQVSETTEPDPEFEAELAGVPLHGGWFLLVVQGIEHRLTDPAVLSQLAKRWRCLSCVVEEHAMVSYATLWRAGHMAWSVGHDAQKGILHLEATGDLPPSFRDLRDRTLQEQTRLGGQAAEEDLVFEVPLLLARELVGFKHDEAPTHPFESEPRVFEVIGETALGRPWWKLW